MTGHNPPDCRRFPPPGCTSPSTTADHDFRLAKRSTVAGRSTESMRTTSADPARAQSTYSLPMASPLRTLANVVRRAVSHRDLDLYVLAAGALVFTVLGSAGMANASALSSATLGLLTFLALAQIRSRRQVAEIAETRRMTRTEVLRSNFPEDLVVRRQEARSLLLIGRSLGRTIETSRTYLRHSLAAGADVRVLMVDPDDDSAVRVAASSTADFARIERLRSRIRASLEDSPACRRRAAGSRCG